MNVRSVQSASFKTFLRRFKNSDLWLKLHVVIMENMGFSKRFTRYFRKRNENVSIRKDLTYLPQDILANIDVFQEEGELLSVLNKKWPKPKMKLFFDSDCLQKNNMLWTWFGAQLDLGNLAKEMPSDLDKVSSAHLNLAAKHATSWDLCKTVLKSKRLEKLNIGSCQRLSESRQEESFKMLEKKSIFLSLDMTTEFWIIQTCST